MTDALIVSLRRAVGAEHVLEGSLTAGYATDWTGRFGAPPRAVVRPADHDEVAEVVALCAASGASVVPQGGNTGLVGGGVPESGEVVLNLRRLDALGPVDVASAQVTAGAGATLEALQHAAASAGLAYGVDIASRGAATVGGMIATNAGGIHVLRHGATRAQVVDVRAVLADGGSVGSLRGLVKDNSGYHLPSLLAGSEGTLAVVTAARLALVPRSAHRCTALVGFSSLDQAVEAAGRWRSSVPGIQALELVTEAGVHLVVDEVGLAPPPTGWATAWLVAEAAGDEQVADRLGVAVGDAPGVTDAAVAADDHRRQEQLWAYRELQSEAISRLGPVHKLDVALPTASIVPFAATVGTAVGSACPGAATWLFGHVADGNLHVNVTGVDSQDESVEEVVFTMVAELGGSISAEHGIGRAKRGWLHLTRSPTEIGLMRSVKRALDPGGILNPGVLLPPD
jgi:FAD/FMN-containing dehydrogenase